MPNYAQFAAVPVLPPPTGAWNGRTVLLADGTSYLCAPASDGAYAWQPLSTTAVASQVVALTAAVESKADAAVPTASEAWAAHLGRRHERNARQKPAWKRG